MGARHKRTSKNIKNFVEFFDNKTKDGLNVLNGLGNPFDNVNDGQEVYIRWSRQDNTLLRCTVACAAGNMARVVNQSRKVDKWMRTDDLLVPTDEIARRVMES